MVMPLKSSILIMLHYVAREILYTCRPIHLLPCLSKIMERIIKNRLEFIVEREKLLKPEQCGFRKAQGTTDILLRLEHRIWQAFENRNVSLVVYIDLKSAFDKVWGKELIYKLSKYGLQGNILKWLDNYFKDRKIQVRLDGHLSSKFDTSAGTPQGQSALHCCSI